MVCNSVSEVLVVGGGLAGSEAAWQLAESGIKTVLVEMRPNRSTPAHSSGQLAELVCSNSLRGDALTNAVGLLKAEMAIAGSLIVESARKAAVPAGGALAVDRDLFSQAVTEAISSHPFITVDRREIKSLPKGPAIIATGPLTAPALHSSLVDLLGEDALAFFDAVAPIVAADSLDMSKLFWASRYDKGEGADYLNVPLDRDAYEGFIDALLAAEKVPLRDFETRDIHYFEGCLPIEVMAERGRETLRFGPMKPVGLVDPATNCRPWAVVQLRQDDLSAENWNLVGFQTKLTQTEQKRVFGMLPGLEKARFIRFGMIHRNTFINAPLHLDAWLRLRSRPELRLAGQITGVEGYVESAAIGLLAGRFLGADLRGTIPVPPPRETALGGLLRHLAESNPSAFQPANINWGLMIQPPDALRVRKRRERRIVHAEKSLEYIRAWVEAVQ